MKKIIALSLTASLLLSIAACGSNGGETTANNIEINVNAAGIHLSENASAEEVLMAITPDYSSISGYIYNMSDLLSIGPDTNASEYGIIDEASMVFSSVDANGKFNSKAYGEIDVFVVEESSQLKNLQPGDKFIIHHYETEGASEYDDTHIVTAIHGNYILYILENMQDKESNSRSPFGIEYNQSAYNRFISIR